MRSSDAGTALWLSFRVRGIEEVQAALEGLCCVALVQLSRGGFPPLYESGVRYQQERGTESWLGPRDVLRLGRGDCEDLVAWRVAELVLGKVVPQQRARPYCYAPRPGLVHCQVRLANGSIEDPSRRLGMGGGA